MSNAIRGVPDRPKSKNTARGRSSVSQCPVTSNSGCGAISFDSLWKSTCPHQAVGANRQSEDCACASWMMYAPMIDTTDGTYNSQFRVCISFAVVRKA